MTTPENSGETMENALAETAKQLFDGTSDLSSKRRGLHLVYSIASADQKLVIEVRSRDDMNRILHHLSPEEHTSMTPLDSDILEKIDPRQVAPIKTIRNDPNILIGRNDLCRCGSGKKFKRCCGTAK